jgi:hypothetical protein
MQKTIRINIDDLGNHVFSSTLVYSKFIIVLPLLYIPWVRLNHRKVSASFCFDEFGCPHSDRILIRFFAVQFKVFFHFNSLRGLQIREAASNAKQIRRGYSQSFLQKADD